MSRPHSKLLPPRNVEYTSEPLAFSFVTNASRLLLTDPVRSNAPVVVGKFGDCVMPVMYALPAASAATPYGVSALEPPRYVEYAIPGSITRSRCAS